MEVEQESIFFQFVQKKNLTFPPVCHENRGKIEEKSRENRENIGKKN